MQQFSQLRWQYVLCDTSSHAESAALPVQESKPTDERVITALMTVYRLSGDDDAAIRLIEGAVAQQPDSEGLNKELHFCYLNSGKLPDMQKLSMKLFKSQSNA